MSGRRKGQQAEAEVSEALRGLGLRVVPAQRDGEAPDVDAFVQAPARGRWIPLQVKREEGARPVAWGREYASRGVPVAYRRNRERWTVLALNPRTWEVEAHDLEAFAALVLGGVL